MIRVFMAAFSHRKLAAYGRRFGGFGAKVSERVGHNYGSSFVFIGFGLGSGVEQESDRPSRPLPQSEWALGFGLLRDL